MAQMWALKTVVRRWAREGDVLLSEHSPGVSENWDRVAPN
jgi:hypothetical protein